VNLPNGRLAIIDTTKLSSYVLSEEHPRGRNKARVFQAALGLTALDASVLEKALREAATFEAADVERHDAFGDHFRLDFSMTHKGRTARVRSLWTIRKGETVPRLVSAFVL
jgi:hypothetical protein